ncbi:hypothetical protein AOLI_G00036070 [Acnodon oligacanthus]
MFRYIPLPNSDGQSPAFTPEEETEIVNMRVMELEASEIPHTYVYMDETGFNLNKVNEPLWMCQANVGGNIVLCAAGSDNLVIHHVLITGPYNTECLLVFLEGFYTAFVPEIEREVVGPDLPNYVVIWDNVGFHHSHLVREWSTHCDCQFLPPYSPFLTSTKEFLSAWK